MKCITYTEEHLSDPDPKLELNDWSFSTDLRENWVFHELRSNHEITEELREAGVLEGVKTDSEYSCFWSYFDSKEEGVAFLERLDNHMRVKAENSPDLWDRYVRLVAGMDEVAIQFIKADKDRTEQYLAWVRERLECAEVA